MDEEVGEAALDDGTLVHIFAFLTLQQRHSTLALVCKRWRLLLDHPRLLQHVTVHLEDVHGDGEERLRTLSSFLHHHAAPHVQQLEVALSAGDGNYCGALRNEVLGNQFVASLVACGTTGHLTSLRVNIDSPLWLVQQELGALRSLRQLRVDAYVQHEEAYKPDSQGPYISLRLDGPAELSTLQELRLDGSKVTLTGGLPPTLTSLYLDGFFHFPATGTPLHCLPRQLEALTALRSLGLARVYSTSPDDYQQLSQLGQLERLSLHNCTHLPACLSVLTTLRVLRLDGTPHGWYGRGRTITAALGAALRPLGLLSHLVLRNIDCLGSGLPLELAGLAQLQRFYWLQQHEESPGNLPSGPWLASLRQVTLNTATAAANLRVLTGAHQLEALVAVDTLGSDNAHSRYEHRPALATWANQRPSLHRLGICPSELPWLAEKSQAWQELRTRVAHLGIRPSLSIQSGTSLMCELGFMAEDSTDTTF